MRSHRLFPVLFFAFILNPCWSQQSWNLSNDWSETKGNPNGYWTYANGSGQPFPTVVQDFNTPDMGIGQTGWSGLGPSHEGWAKSIGASPHDFPLGTVGAHGPARLIWTCPGNDTFVVKGGGWMFRHIGRSVTWRIWKNGVQITQGTQNDATTQFNSTNPEPWSNGTGGSRVLTMTLVAGDTLVFGHDDPDFFAYTITITGSLLHPTATPPGPTPTPTITPTLILNKNLWDLEADWSEVNGNPNDAWTYAQENGQPFPSVVQEFIPGDLGLHQTAWAGITPTHLGWARATGNSKWDFPAGRIMAHGPGRIVWTCPKPETYVISGGGWMLRHIGREVTWHIWLNANELSHSTQNNSSPYNSTNPEPWHYGSGGIAALTQDLQAGDRLIFGHDDNDFFGYRISIFVADAQVSPTATPPPTRTPTPTIATAGNPKVFKLDSQSSTEYLGVGVADFNGDGVPEIASTVKGGAPGVFNDTNIFFLKNIDLETITEPFDQIPNEAVYTAGADEGAWFAAAGDFLGNGRSQLLVNHRADGRPTSSPFGIFSRNTVDPPGTSSAWSLIASLPAEFGSAGSFSQTGRFFPGLTRDFIVIGSGVITNFASRIVGLDNSGMAICSDVFAGPASDHVYRATFLGDISGDGQLDAGYWSQTPRLIAMHGYLSGTCGSLVVTASTTLWKAGQAPFDGFTLPYTIPETGYGRRVGKIFVGDPSKDGRREILVPLSGDEGDSAPGYLLSIQATAATHGGPVSSLAFENEIIDINPQERFTSVISADLDQDGDQEIIAGTFSGFVVGFVRRDLAPGYTPGNINSVAQGNQYVRFVLSGNGLGIAQPIGSYVADIGAGDVDNDGAVEIVVSTGYPGNDADIPGTYVIDEITVPLAPPLQTGMQDWKNY